MGWASWNRKSPAVANPENAPLGIDLNATRFRAALAPAGRSRPILLEDPHLDLPLALNLEGRSPDVGRAGLRISRKLPHLTCAGYLPFLGQDREWQCGRHRLDAQTALVSALEKLRPIIGSFASVSLAVPAYLTLAQVNRLSALAAKQRWPLVGTAVNTLALAADRAPKVLGELNDQVPPNEGQERVLRMHRPGTLAAGGTILILDADDFALTGSVIRVEREQVLLSASAYWPKLGVKNWKDRMLDALCDRCIRLCRRDPRDSADAEQEIYEQLDEALDRIRVGQKVCLTVRAFHWYQDIEHQPSEFEAYCSAFLKHTVEVVQDLLNSAGLSELPDAVWLTHDAGRLPGLPKALHQHMSERTRVSILQPDAVAIAVAHLVERRKAGAIPKSHLDTSIPIVLPIGDATKPQTPVTRARRS